MVHLDFISRRSYRRRDPVLALKIEDLLGRFWGKSRGCLFFILKEETRTKSAQRIEGVLA